MVVYLKHFQIISPKFIYIIILLQRRRRVQKGHFKTKKLHSNYSGIMIQLEQIEEVVSYFEIKISYCIN